MSESLPAVHSQPAGCGDAQTRALWEEVQALRAENDRLRHWLERIIAFTAADSHDAEAFHKAAAQCALNGEPADSEEPYRMMGAV